VRLEGDTDLIFPEAQHVAVAQQVSLRAALGERFGLVVHVDAVGAEIFQIIATLTARDARMPGRNVALRIGQDPIVVGRAADAAALGPELDAVPSRQLPAVAADDAQTDGHGVLMGRVMVDGARAGSKRAVSGA